MILMRSPPWTRAVSADNIQTLSMNLRITVAVDDHGDEARSVKAVEALNIGLAPSATDRGLMVSGSTIVGKRSVKKEAEERNKNQNMPVQSPTSALCKSRFSRQ